VIAAAFPGQRVYNCKGIRSALQAAELPVRCKNRQLQQYVTRENRIRRGAPATAGVPVVAELLQQCQAWCREQPHDWASSDMSALRILGTPHITSTRVCVCWSTLGMLRTIDRDHSPVLTLVVDGKQRVVSNTYTIVTLAIMVRGQRLTPTTTQRHPVRQQSRAATTTATPLAQALVDSESAENMTAFFQTVCQALKDDFGVDLAKHVLQVQKDSAAGEEAARRAVFARSRPLNDFAHVSRQAHSTLQRARGA